MIPKLSRKHRLMLTIAISLSFFVAELIAGFYTHSLALVADAFHYLSDLIGFVVALVALMVSERSQPPPRAFTFGWQRATLLGAFFNGVFLLALGVSILVQAIERFINVHEIEKPKLVLIVGCVGLGLNVLVLSFLHEHDHDHDHGHDDGHHHNHSHVHTHSESYGHTDSLNTENTGLHRSDKSPIDIESRTTSVSSSHREHRHSVSSRAKAGRDLGMLGVLIHVAGDAINNIGVIASAVIIWKAEGEGRYYADPAIGVFIAVMVFLTAVPLVRKSGTILLQIAPDGVDLDDVKKDIESIPGVESIHELHIWRLDQHKSVASAHVVVDSTTVDSFTDKAKIIMECLHAYGIHSVTLQPELDSYTHYSALSALPAQPMTERDAGIRRQVEERGCQLGKKCSRRTTQFPVAEDAEAMSTIVFRAK